MADEPTEYPLALRCPGCTMAWPVPDWKDTARATAAVAALRNHLESSGHLGRFKHLTIDQLIEAIKASTT